MRSIPLRALLALGLLSVTASASAAWQRSGLDGQTVYAVAGDPTNANVLYASTFQKIWKSTNGGAHWTDSHTGRISS